MPGEDPLEAARIIAGELPDLPHLAELPARGPGADMTGRAAALLVDIPVELAGPRGWRIAERPGRDLRRARGLLSADLDAMEETLDGYPGLLKVQLAGPWTLAATHRAAALAEPGARRPRPGRRPRVVAGRRRRRARRRGREADTECDHPRPARRARAAGGRRGRGADRRAACPASARSKTRCCGRDCTRCSPPRGRYTAVHCCGRDLPFGIIMSAGADAVSFDASLLRNTDFDGFARRLRRAWAAGRRPVRLRLSGTSGVTPADTARTVAEVWRKMSLPPGECAPQVVITPACGLAGASPAQARDALRWVREAARILPEMMEELALWSWTTRGSGTRS